MSDSNPLWSTLPRILGSIAAVIGAVAGLVGILDALDLIDVLNRQESVETTETPLPIATEMAITPADSSPNPSATSPADDRQAIEQAITRFSSEMRYVLETNDTSRFVLLARGDVLQDRLDAVAIQEASGCRWRYTETSPDTVQNVQIIALNSTSASVVADLHVDGTVFCAGVEQVQSRFEGPTRVSFIVEYSDGQWWVTEREVVG